MNSRVHFTPPDTRLFIQKGGTLPGVAYGYLGCAELGDTTLSLGERTIIRRQNAKKAGQWDTIGQEYGIPDLHGTSIRASMPPATASFLERASRSKCDNTFQVVIGKCDNQSEFNSWESKALYEVTNLSEVTIPGWGGSVDGNGNGVGEIFIGGTLQFSYYARILKTRFSERGAAEVLAEVLDGVYCGDLSCGQCGTTSDGCDHTYAITETNPGSPGLSGAMVYSNNGVDFATVDIPTLGGLDPSKVACIGKFLVVISEAAENLQYQEMANVLTSSAWTENNVGIVSGEAPRAIYVKSVGEIFYGGAGGTVYSSTNFQVGMSQIQDSTLTSEDVNAIDGDGDQVIVTVHNNNALLFSDNNGESFSLLTGPSVGADLHAIVVLSDTNWIVGGTLGAFFRTSDQGESWTAIPYVGSGVGATVWDIDVAEETPTVICAAIETNGIGDIFRSTDGGTSFFNTSPSVAGMTTNDRLNFVSVCPNDLNKIFTGGLATGSTDGFLALASPSETIC